MSDTDRKYRPSNGTEGELFTAKFCDNCRHYDDCDIFGDAFLFGVDEPEYPAEWTYTDQGKPTCTAFERAEGGQR